MVKPTVKKSASKTVGKKAGQKFSPMSAPKSESDSRTKISENAPGGSDNKAAALDPGPNGIPSDTGNPLAQAQQALGPIKSQSGIDLTEKVKELLRLAQEQG